MWNGAIMGIIPVCDKCKKQTTKTWGEVCLAGQVVFVQVATLNKLFSSTLILTLNRRKFARFLKVEFSLFHSKIGELGLILSSFPSSDCSKVAAPLVPSSVHLFYLLVSFLPCANQIINKCGALLFKLLLTKVQPPVVGQYAYFVTNLLSF